MNAAAVFAQPGYGADAGRHDLSCIRNLSTVQHLYCVETQHLGSSLPFEKLIVDAKSPYPSPNKDPNTVAYLAFTSGTTQQPKGVMHTDNTLLASARALAKDWQFDSATRIYTLSPLSHNLGFGALITSIVAGGELILHDVVRGESICERLLKTEASFLFGVPTHAVDLLQELRARGAKRLGSVRGFRISGAACTPEVLSELMEYEITPQSGYGMTETCSHQYTLPSDTPATIAETCGRACAGYEIRIWRQDDPNTEAEIGQVGEIGGRGASLMLGYFNDQTSTENSFNASGWFMTGDLGSLDARGYLRITGRKKDVIIRGGHNIYPFKLESLALQHPQVEKAVAFAMPDPRLGERVCLALVWRNGDRHDDGELLDFLDSAGLSKYDMPEYLLELDAVPMTASGKVLKRLLSARIAAGELSPRPVKFRAFKSATN
jgi:acyl-CoA synthetase